MNKFLVGAQGDKVTVGLPMQTARMTREDALLLAAWLVAMSMASDEEFKSVQNSINS